jgi:hypothetical protein
VSIVTQVGRLALGDFRDQARRPVYPVMLLAAVGLGYLALPDPQTHWTVLDLAGYRGIYNSAYVGAATALTGTLWLTLGGFYVVRNSIGRDEFTGVGELLSATSLRTSAYLAAKFLGNVLLLASMAGVLALTAVVLQLARGESRTIDPVALLLPFLLLTLPMLAVTAALAIGFETVPRLRGGAGNVVWFVLALVIAIGGQSAGAPLGGLGVQPVFASLRAAIAEHGGIVPGSEFSFGLTYRDAAFRTIDWPGFAPTPGFLLNRLLLVLLAVALALLPTLWFPRFDPARKQFPDKAKPSPSAAPEPITAVPSGRTTLPALPPRTGITFGRLVSGELRILLQGVSRWWWLVALGLTIAGAAVPVAIAPTLLLPIWVWPVVIWARLGSQRVEHDLEGLLRAYPRARRRVLAEWAAGVVLTAGVAIGPSLRMALDPDPLGLAAWVGGVLFIPSSALLLGVLSRSHRLFQGLYLPLWYLVVNGVAGVDYMGAVRWHGRPAGPSSGLIVGAALTMLLVAVAVDSVRDRGISRRWPGRSPQGRSPQGRSPEGRSLPDGSQPDRGELGARI